ncbi:MAG: carboxypeptidase regulatory-like domain-containing protein [Bacteroidales bacterium]|nr:carboxypeptidase regulatory-like domain-containing protein [Bacteroidales bacterium]
MDNLLLTQGWRNYIWKQLSDTNKNMNYSTEKGITISGRLTNSLGNNPLTNVNISMAIFDNENPIYRFTNTDSTGKYSFEAINFTGVKTMVISASDKRNMPKGIISVDSTYYSYPSITGFYDKASKYNAVEETIDKEFSQKKYNVTDTIRLKEVLVKAVKPKIKKQ